jgi:hypothetical protein
MSSFKIDVSLPRWSCSTQTDPLVDEGGGVARRGGFASQAPTNRFERPFNDHWPLVL